MDALDTALGELGLGQHTDAFRAAHIDLDVLPLLSEADLKELGLSLGHRRKLMQAISAGRLKPVPVDESSPGIVLRSKEQELRPVTVLVCDLVGSTEMTQRLEPEAMGWIVRQFEDVVAGVITRFEGFVDRFMGDSVLAFFGYPHAHEDAAERAVRAGLAIIEAVRGIPGPEGRPLAVRSAVASGSAYFGEIVEHAGAREMIVTGEVINLACRMQSVAPENGLVVSPRTRAQLREIFDLDDLGPHEFKGIGRPVHIWRLTAERSSVTRFEAAQSRVLPPIVGREAEIALLLERWELARSGEGQVVLLSGDAGIGKSRIAQALRDRIAGEPHLAIQYQCSSFHRNSALYPVVAQLQFAAGIKAADPPALRLAKLEALVANADVPLAEHVPPLADLLSIPLGEAYAPLDPVPEMRKRRTMQVLRDHFLALAARQPVLFLLEDANWIDPTTLELLTSVVMSIQAARVLLLVTYRPGFKVDWVGLPYVTALALSGLSRRQALAIVNQVAGVPLPPELVELLLAKTDGIPLFVEELAKTILELGVARKRDGRYELINPLTTLAIPATLHDSLLARLDRNSAAKELAQIDAVIGREFAYSLLSAIASLKGNALTAAIQELLRAELVHQRGEAQQTSYVFKHALIQEAAYSTLIPSRRQKLHAECAAILVELSPEIAELQPEMLAHHYTEAGQAEAAVRCWLQAGRNAARRSANVEAIAHLRQGLRVAPQISDSAERLSWELLLEAEIGVPLIATQGYAAPETNAAWERVRALAEQLGDDAQLARALYGLWAAYLSRGDARVALDVSTRILGIGRRIADDGVVVVGHRMRGLTLHTLGDQDGGQAELEKSLAEYNFDRHRNLGIQFGQNPRLAANAILSTVLWLQGWPSRAWQLSLSNLEEAVAFRHVNSLAYALGYGACLVAMLRGDTAETLRLANQLLALATDNHLHLWRAYAEAYKGWARVRLGGGDALLLLDQSRRGFERAGAALYQPLFAGIIAYGLHTAGRREEGIRRAREAVAEAERRQELWCLPELLRIEARMLRRHGEIDVARAVLDRAMAVAREHRLLGWQLRVACDIANLARGAGDAAASAALLRPLLDAFPEQEETPDRHRALSLIDGGARVLGFPTRTDA